MLDKLRAKICTLIMPKTFKMVYADETTVNELVCNQVKSVEQSTEVLTKDFLEYLIKEIPKPIQPNLIESNGNVKFTDSTGKTAQVKVPLLTIVPIPYIFKDSIDLNKYYKENFGESNPPKSIEDIKGVQVNVPTLNIVPIPKIPVKNKKNENK